MTGRKPSFQVRLPPDILTQIDQGVKEGKWTSRSDFMFRAAFFYLTRESILDDAGKVFKKMFYSEEFQKYVKTIVSEENDRVLGNGDQK